MNQKSATGRLTTKLLNADGQETVSVLGATIIRFAASGAGHRDLDTRKLSEIVKKHAMFHGLVQRVSDRAAISRDEKSGKSATPAEKLAAMNELIEFYEAGGDEWAMQRSGVGTTDGKILAAALKRAYPHLTDEKVTEFLKGKSASEQRQLLVSDKIRPHADAVRAEMAKDVDVDDMLKELESIEENLENPE
jgi:hypothetical protein